MIGPSEAWVWEALEPWLPAAGRMVDAGAHEGEWALACAHRFGEVIAIEPQAELCERQASIVRYRPLICVEAHSRQGFGECLRLLGSWEYGVTVVRHPAYERGSALWHAHAWLIGHP